MGIRNLFYAIVVALFGISAAFSVSAAPEQGSADATTFIEGLADDVVGSLTDENHTRETRIGLFRELLEKNFNVPLIGKWVMGRYWRAASVEEKTEYMELFEDLVVITYVDRFDQYSGEKLKVVNTVMDEGKDPIVYSEIVRPNGGEPIRVDWRVRQNGDVYKIIDVYVEGISMGQTQRSEFASVIRQNGGKVSGLLAVLREKVASLKQQ